MELFKEGMELLEIHASNIQQKNEIVHSVARWNGMDHFVLPYGGSVDIVSSGRGLQEMETSRQVCALGIRR
ncbi:unnamed protein product [Lactuca virosa]|uniref:Uncharacterized protein n=1 Tax=Lactuca virosa TaxID=75947 RepID=A0AAU9NAA2_9ASTR|nr:unnamed protein product [Lactuca virosa]